MFTQFLCLLVALPAGPITLTVDHSSESDSFIDITSAFRGTECETFDCLVVDGPRLHLFGSSSASFGCYFVSCEVWHLHLFVVLLKLLKQERPPVGEEE